MGLERRGRVNWSHDRSNWKQEDLDACDRQAVRLACLLDGSRMSREVHVRLCDQKRLARSVGDRPTEVKVRSLVAWIAGRREIEFPKPIDKAIFRMVSKSSGRNESERRCGLESDKPQGLSLQPEGESSMDRRRLTDAAVFTLAG